MKSFFFSLLSGKLALKVDLLKCNYCNNIWGISLVQKFNPKIFKKKQKNGSSTKSSCPYCCCAVGSKDRSLSVWVSGLFATFELMWLFG